MSLPPLETESLLLYDIDPEVVAAAVLSCPAVAAMSGGPYGAAATYLPGRAVIGVRSGGDRVEVHVVLAHRATVDEAGGQIWRALQGYAAGRAVDIVVEDVADPGDGLQQLSSGDAPAAVGFGWPPRAAPAYPGGVAGTLRPMPET